MFYGRGAFAPRTAKLARRARRPGAGLNWNITLIYMNIQIDKRILSEMNIPRDKLAERMKIMKIARQAREEREDSEDRESSSREK